MIGAVGVEGIRYGEVADLPETRDVRIEFHGPTLAAVGAVEPAGAAELIEYDWERMVTFYDFPKAHWKHLRTTNIIESPFAAVRLRTAAAKRYKKVANATAVIWKTLMVAESRFRRLDAPHLVAEVAEGAVFVDGERFFRREKVAA